MACCTTPLSGSRSTKLQLAILTMLVATPIGVALALGLARWRGRGVKASNLLMLIPLVIPEIVMGVALFLVFAEIYDFVPFRTWTQFLGHVTFSISFVVIIVRGRLFAIGRDYEEAAMDLGASQSEAMRRVLLRLLAPALSPASPSSSPSQSTISSSAIPDRVGGETVTIRCSSTRVPDSSATFPQRPGHHPDGGNRGRHHQCRALISRAGQTTRRKASALESVAGFEM